MQQPQSIKNVQNAVDQMMGKLSKAHLIPAQKEAFLCCAGVSGALPQLGLAIMWDTCAIDSPCGSHHWLICSLCAVL